MSEGSPVVMLATLLFCEINHYHYRTVLQRRTTGGILVELTLTLPPSLIYLYAHISYPTVAGLLLCP